MSVINQVLLELEKRRASGAERGALPDHVRALPEGGRDDRGWWIAAAGAAAIALLAMAWLAMDGLGFLRQPPIAAIPSPGTAAIIEKVVAATAAVVTDVAPVDESGRGDAPRPAARLSFELASPPAARSALESQSEPTRQPAPIPTARLAGRSSGERNAGSPPHVAPAPVTAAAPGADKDTTRHAVALAAAKPSAPATGKGEIEKQVRQPTGRELADAEYRKAVGLLQQGRLAEAQDALRAAVNVHPGHHGARQALVALLLDAKQHGDAERVLQDGLKVAPEQIGFAMTFARLQVERGETAAAIATLKTGRGHAQASADYVAVLAALLQRQGRHEDAIEQFHAALRVKPNAGVWWLGLGMSLQAAQRGAEAQDAFRRAKATNNLNPELAAFADQRLRQLQ